MSPLDLRLFKSRIDRDQYGFLTEEDAQILAKDKLCRLEKLLVRCGSCRFVCSAQYVAHIIAALESAGDYVRDVTFEEGRGEIVCLAKRTGSKDVLALLVD
jgi:hypothetical protein